MKDVKKITDNDAEKIFEKLSANDIAGALEILNQTFGGKVSDIYRKGAMKNAEKYDQLNSVQKHAAHFLSTNFIWLRLLLDEYLTQSQFQYLLSKLNGEEGKTVDERLVEMIEQNLAKDLEEFSKITTETFLESKTTPPKEK